MSRFAPYAVPVDGASDRAHPEPDDPLRLPFDVDLHRILESTAFRRLERKTQVFSIAHHDHFRTRLTHTLEAAGLSRTLAKALHANDALAEAITLAHDLGHPPFGHAGETALNQAMENHGGFNHNLHTLRVVDYLEHPFPAFRGLNLTSETRSGIVTHATLFDEPADADPPSHAGAAPSSSLPTRPSVEAQIASLADRIAYDCHDLEDAIGAGFVSAETLAEVPIWREAFERVRDHAAAESLFALRRPILNGIADALLTDIVATSQPMLANVRSLKEVRTARRSLVSLSDHQEARLTHLERCLSDNVYCHPDVRAMDARGRDVVGGLFTALVCDPAKLPKRFADRIAGQGVQRVVCDYIAGMTDPFAEKESHRLDCQG